MGPDGQYFTYPYKHKLKPNTHSDELSIPEFYSVNNINFLKPF